MDLLTPDPGLVFWTGITFLTLLFLLRKYAWRPILHALRVREHSIKNALASAEKIREEARNIEVLKKQTLEEAALQRDKIIAEARELKDKIIEEAKVSAQKEADKIIEKTRIQLEKEKREIVEQMKAQVAQLSVDIAGKLLREELSTTTKQKEIINRYLDDVSFN
ncbi:MAG: F0F1 ATP synthase subunit B [Chlorobi bacterium]|nr:F0F1 ATP synthase subunit B [Chlorobiota bacterium]